MASAHGQAKKARWQGHHQCFNNALEDALSKLSRDIHTGNYTVAVELFADVEVTNPGSIGLYKVKLTEVPAVPAVP